MGILDYSDYVNKMTIWEILKFIQLGLDVTCDKTKAIELKLVRQHSLTVDIYEGMTPVVWFP